MAHKLDNRFLNTDTAQFEQQATSPVNVKVKVNPTGGVQFGPTGLELVVPDGQNTRGMLDPAGGTIALPTAAGAETTVSNGEALGIGDRYLIDSDGTVGGIPVTAGGELVFNNSGDGTADGHWTFRPLATAGHNREAVSYSVVAADLVAAPMTITLPSMPSNAVEVSLIIDGAPSQAYGVGYTVAGTTLTVVNALRDLLIAGDEIRIAYDKAA